MASVEREIEVDVPVTVAYEQWARFEELPRFLDGVELVERQGERRLRFTSRVDGALVAWDAAVLEMIPDLLISWTATSGRVSSGTVTFATEGCDSTTVKLAVEYDERSLPADVGDVAEFVAGRVEADLQRFKDHIESVWAAAQAHWAQSSAGQAAQP